MDRMRKTTTFLARVCLGLAIAAVFAANAAAQRNEPVGPEKPVVVVNKPDAPVPVTGTVGITTSQPVPVTGTVGITTSQPLPVMGTVEVATTEADPLIVRNVASAARQPFQRVIFMPGTPNFTVPAGKLAVIEFASMGASVVTECRIISLNIQTIVDGTNVVHSLPPTTVAIPGRNFETVGQQVRIYADPGTTVTFSIFTQTTAPCAPLGSMTVSGHFEDVP